MQLPTDAERIKTEADEWVQLAIERLRELRMLKMKLKVAQQLQEQGVALHDDVFALIPFIAFLP
jgi:hypothetical protein